MILDHHIHHEHHEHHEHHDHYRGEELLSVVSAVVSQIDITEGVIVSLLLVVSIVAIGASYMKVPYTVALVSAGLLLGVSGVFTSVSLTKDVILLVFLPPLVFEGAINLHLDVLKKRWGQVALLAVVGTIFSAAVIALALLLIPGIPAPAAFLVAVMLAPTDPVSVLAIFKANGVATGLRTLLEGESLFNDALGIVLYIVAVDIAFPSDEHGATVVTALGEFGREIGLGVAVGVIVGLVAHRLMRTLSDRLVEITLSLVTAYGAYLVADRLHGSGIIATVAAGLLIGNYGTDRSMSEQSWTALHGFWEVISFLANSALFLLIGLDFNLGDLTERRTLTAAVVAAVTILAARAIATYGLLRPFRRSASPDLAVPAAWLPAVIWGGLRGGIPIALVLGLEGKKVGNTNTEALVFAVVLASLIGQGLTYAPLLRRLGLLSAVDHGEPKN